MDCAYCKETLLITDSNYSNQKTKYLREKPQKGIGK